MKHYLFASDFDQTLSFNDSGHVLSEMLGIGGFAEKTAGLSEIHLVQQGGRARLSAAARPRVSPRAARGPHRGRPPDPPQAEHLGLLSRLLEAVDGFGFTFYVVSAAPEEVIRSALKGIVPESRIYGTQFRYDQAPARSVHRAGAGGLR